MRSLQSTEWEVTKDYLQQWFLISVRPARKFVFFFIKGVHGPSGLETLTYSMLRKRPLAITQSLSITKALNTI
jgi:hypothetical protein